MGRVEVSLLVSEPHPVCTFKAQITDANIKQICLGLG